MELPRARRAVIVGLLRMLVLGVELEDGVCVVGTPLANDFDLGLANPLTASFVFLFASPFAIIALPFPFPITDFTDFFLSSPSVSSKSTNPMAPTVKAPYTHLALSKE